MKKILSSIFMLVFILSSMAGTAVEKPQIWGSQSKLAARPMHQTHKIQKADVEPQWVTILTEDFSKMTAGADDVPDATELTGAMGQYNLPIPDQYTNTPGWTGAFIYQAGGSVAIGYPNFGGALNTPDGYYTGHLRISYRAKAVGGRVTSWCIGGKGTALAPSGSSTGDMLMMNIDTLNVWKDYEFEMYFPNILGFIQFNVVYSPGQLVIDDFKIERDLNYIAAPVDLKAFDFTDDGFSATWSPLDMAEKYRVVLDNENGETIVDEIVTDPQKTFTGLDMGKEYYYNAYAITGNDIESMPSDTCWAYGLPAPHVTEATDVNDRGAFTANWESAPKATQYQVSIFKVTTPETDELDKVVFNEDFFKCTYGSRDFSDIQFLGNFDGNDMLLDEFTDNPGWLAQGTALAGDLIGCPVPYPGENLHLTSPALCVNSNGGKFKIDVTYYVGTKGLLYAQSNKETKLLTCDDPSAYNLINATLEYNDGNAATKIKFYGDGSDFLIDRFTVKQDAQAGEPFYSIESNGETEELHYRASGLDTEETTQYAYIVVARYQAANGVWYSSKPSELMTVSLTGEEPSGVTDLTASSNMIVEYFDLQGRKVTNPQSGGIYIMRAGNEVKKVIMK